jgi:AAA domain
MPHEGDGLARLGMVELVPRLRPLSAAEFMRLNLPPRGLILDPILPEKGLMLLHAYRGIGKTHLALGIGYCIATGGGMVGWTAPEARRVLYLDGEMPAAERWIVKNPPEADSSLIRVWGVLKIYRPPGQTRWSKALVRHGSDAPMALAAVLGIAAEDIGVRKAIRSEPALDQSHHQKNDQDHEQEADAPARVVPPAPAIGPGR